jgi:Flp pilus assembly protein TadD
MDPTARITALWARWPKGDDRVDDDLLAMAHAAVEEHPDSAELWWIAGSLNELARIEGADTDSPSALDPLACYRRAVAIDPSSARAWTSLGAYLDVWLDDLEGAETALRTALRHAPESDAFEVLARVLAQQGRRAEALDVLDRHPADSTRTLRAEIERGDWDSDASDSAC